MQTELLSYAEQRLWNATHDATSFVDCPVHFTSVARLVGPLDVPALTSAFNQFVSRHDVTRSTYAADGERTVRVIAPFVPIELPVTGLTGGDESTIKAALAETVGAPFDFTGGSLLRVRLLKLGEQDHVFAVVAHHIIFDGWSLHVMWRELAAVYDAEANGQARTAPELKASYADYAAWQRKRLDAARLETLEAYWTERLRGARSIALAGDRTQPAPEGRRSAAEPVVVPKETVDRLRRFCLDQGATPGVALAAVFKLLLHSLTGSVDLAVGMPVADRNRPEFEAVAGLFMNLVVLRTDLSNDPTFLELMERVRQTFIDAYKNRELPFGLLSGVDPHTFGVVFNFFVARRAAASLPGLTVQSIDMSSESPSYADFGLHLFDTGDRVHGFVVYDTALFSRGRIAEIIARFIELLSAVLTAPERRISDYAAVVRESAS
jgi:hypothetical protein